MAIGQGDVAVTPIQLANAYATFANGGTRVRAEHRAEGDPGGPEASVKRTIGPRINGTIDLPPEVRDPILQGLLGVTSQERGTAYGVFKGFPLQSFPVAGKTGTAQVTGRPTPRSSAPSAPSPTPTYEVTVVMEASGFGGTAAAPVARKLFDVFAGVTPPPTIQPGGALLYPEACRATSPPRISSPLPEVTTDGRLRRPLARHHPGRFDAPQPGGPVAPRRPAHARDHRAISIIGTLMVFSSTRGPDAGNPQHRRARARHLVFLATGFTVMALVTMVDYRRFRDLPSSSTGPSAALLVGVISPLGTEVNGAQAWFAIGSFQLQPSEFTKIAMILILASLGAHFASDIDLRRLGVLLGVAGLPLALIMLQPDPGTGMVLMAIIMGVLLVAGVRPKHIAALTLLGLTALVGILNSGFLADYQKDRLTVFLNPNAGLQAEAYNLNQSKIAIGSGGVLGKGLFKGTQTQLNIVPEQHTDFIFTAVGEELGFIGAATLLVLFAILCWRIWRIAQLSHATAGDADLRRRARHGGVPAVPERRHDHGHHADHRHPAAPGQPRRLVHHRALRRPRARPERPHETFLLMARRLLRRCPRHPVARSPVASRVSASLALGSDGCLHRLLRRCPRHPVARSPCVSCERLAGARLGRVLAPAPSSLSSPSRCPVLRPLRRPASAGGRRVSIGRSPGHRCWRTAPSTRSRHGRPGPGTPPPHWRR